jgi:membrane protein required for beta-lactamase induction
VLRQWLQCRSRIADERYVMLFVVALLVWFALSVPVALVVGRMLAASRRSLATSAPLRRRREHALASR